MTKFEVQDAQKRLAICNDGSPAAYYFRPGLGDNVNKWIIHFKGGAHCNSIASCQQRWQDEQAAMSWDHKMSSLNYPAQKVFEGLFNGDHQVNPTFSHYNHVYMMYCSSDAWTGDKAADSTTGNFHFRGKNIARSIVEDLIREHNLDQAEQILFTGSSAGSIGMRQNLNDLKILVHQYNDAKILAASDSGYNVRANNFLMATLVLQIPYEPMTHQSVIAPVDLFDVATYFEVPLPTFSALNFQNNQLDQNCLRDFNTLPDRCLNDHHLMPYIEATPHFVFQDIKDWRQLRDYRAMPDFDPNFHEHYFTLYNYLDLIDVNASVYSTINGRHVSFTSDTAFHTKYTNNKSLADSLGDFVMDPEVQVKDLPILPWNNLPRF